MWMYNLCVQVSKNDNFINKSYKMDKTYLLDNLRIIPDFPIKWVNFRDVTSLYQDAKAFNVILDELYNMYKDKWITKVVWIESRGFIVWAALADRLWAGFVLCRKPWKLPYKTVKESYKKEYGTDTIEIHEDSINQNDIVLIHDDLLATWWTMKAAYNLVKRFAPKNIFINFVIEISDEWLNGREVFDENVEVTALLD